MAEKETKKKQLKAIRSVGYSSNYVNFSHFTMSNLELIIDSGIKGKGGIKTAISYAV